jgi:hypothetical protein
MPRLRGCLQRAEQLAGLCPRHCTRAIESYEFLFFSFCFALPHDSSDCVVWGSDIFVDKVKDSHEVVCKAIGTLKRLRELDFSRNAVGDNNFMHVHEMVRYLMLLLLFFFFLEICGLSFTP